MQIFFYSVLLLFSNYYITESATAQDKPSYDVPRTAEYPFGDEYFCNTNMLENDTNKLPCLQDQEVNITNLKGKCPMDEPDGHIMDPYISCPGYAQFPPPGELIFSSGGIPGPEVQCKKCDLRLTSDNKAVIVECFQCFDIPNPTRLGN